MKKLLPIIILLVIGGVFFFLENKDNKNIKNVILKKFTPQVEKNDNLVNQSDEDVTSNKNTSEEIIEQEEESIPITSKKESDPAPKQIVESNISDDNSQMEIIEEKENDVINLSDDVTYSYEMKLFECVGCFSNELINNLQNAKGNYLIEGNLHIVYLKRITGLSGKYNNEKYYGTSYINQIITAGGEEKMEKSHSGELLTLKICKQYNLNCKE